MTEDKLDWRPIQWQVILAVGCYLVLSYGVLTGQWGFERDCILAYLLPPLTLIYTFGLLGHHPRIRVWALYTPAVALYGFIACLAQLMRLTSFPDAHASSGDAYLAPAWQLLLTVLLTLLATVVLALPGVKLAFHALPSHDKKRVTTSRRSWYHIAWPNLLAAVGFAAIIYFGRVATLGFLGDQVFRFVLPAYAALVIIGLLMRQPIARFAVFITPGLALAGVIVGYYLAERMNIGVTSYPQPGDTYTYFACECIPIVIFTLPAAVVFFWKGLTAAWQHHRRQLAATPFA